MADYFVVRPGEGLGAADPCGEEMLTTKSVEPWSVWLRAASPVQ